MKHRCLLALAPLLLMLAATGHAERRYFTQYDSPAKAPEQALYYVDLPLPENPDGPGYLYRAYYRENDALYAEGARAGAGPDADWFGDWRYLYPDGDIKQRGHSDDQGRLDGDVISYFENGRIEKVKPYTAGKLDGTEKRYDEDGDLLLELPYKDGARHGMRINYYGEGGGREEGRMVDGLRTGTWRGYDAQDRLISVSHFKKGRLDGEVRERSGPEGERWTYKHYRQDKQHGPWRTENADGEVLESGRYRDGVPVGEWRTLRDTGEQETATYVDGELHGEWRLRSPSGALIAERHYDHGDATGTWKRFQDGELSYRATFKDGKRQGEGWLRGRDGELVKARWEDGRRVTP